MHVYVCVCMCMYVYVCVCMCMYVYVCVCVCKVRQNLDFENRVKCRDIWRSQHIFEISRFSGRFTPCGRAHHAHPCAPTRTHAHPRALTRTHAHPRAPHT